MTRLPFDPSDPFTQALMLQRLHTMGTSSNNCLRRELSGRITIELYGIGYMISIMLNFHTAEQPTY